MASLAILQPDARAAARLTAALSGDHHVVVHTSWDSLNETLSSGSVEGCLLDADHPDRADATNEIIRVRNLYRHLAIVAVTSQTSTLDFYDFGELGIDGVVVDPENPATTRSVVQDALASARGEVVRLSLSDRLPAPGPEAFKWAVQHCGPDASVARLAEALGYSEARLRRVVSSAGLPTPSRILLWGRLLLAGARLAEDGQTTEDVAFSLGYSTANSLGRAMKRHTRLTPHQVSRRGGMHAVLTAILSDSSKRPGGSRRLRPGAFVGLLLLLQAGCPPCSANFQARHLVGVESPRPLISSLSGQLRLPCLATAVFLDDVSGSLHVAEPDSNSRTLV